MKFSQFIDVFVAALYNETEQKGRKDFRVKDILEKYSLTLNPSWGESLFADYEFSSRVEAHRHIGPAQDQHVSISPGGIRWVEDELGENVSTFLEQNGVAYKGTEGQSAPFDSEIFDPAVFDTGQVPENAITTEDGSPLVTEDGDYIVTEDAPSSESTPSQVSSEAWTGIVNRLERDPAVVTRIKQQISYLDKEVEALGLSNHERAKVKAITEALTKLVESPEPEWKAIVELLRSPTLAAVLGLAGLVQLTLKIIFGIS